jgi:hypothetical protein
MPVLPAYAVKIHRLRTNFVDQRRGLRGVAHLLSGL